MEKLREQWPEFIDPLLQYRELEKLRGTYAEGLLHEVADDGRDIGRVVEQVVVRPGPEQEQRVLVRFLALQLVAEGRDLHQQAGDLEPAGIHRCIARTRTAEREAHRRLGSERRKGQRRFDRRLAAVHSSPQVFRGHRAVREATLVVGRRRRNRRVVVHGGGQDQVVSGVGKAVAEDDEPVILGRIRTAGAPGPVGRRRPARPRSGDGEQYESERQDSA